MTVVGRVGLLVLAVLSAQAAAQPSGGVVDPWPVITPAPLAQRPAPRPEPAPVETVPPTPPTTPLETVSPLSPETAAPAADPDDAAAFLPDAKPDDATNDGALDTRQAPVEPPVFPPPVPRAFVDRPLVLPRGVGEFSIGARMSTERVEDVRATFGGAGASIAKGFGGFDLALGVDLLFLQDDNLSDGEQLEKVPLVQRLVGTVTFALPNDSYLGLSGVAGVPFSRYRRYSPSVFVGHKFRPSKRLAIIVSGGADYNRGKAYDTDRVAHRVGGYGNATARFQVTPEFALQASGTIAQIKYVDPDHSMYSASSSLGGSAGILISISETADLTLNVGMASSGDYEVTSGGIGVTMR
jgi:hypothetical protein